MRFIIVGLFNTLIGLSIIYVAMYFFRLNPFVSNAAGYGIGFILGYLLNRGWTFRSRRNGVRTIMLYATVLMLSYLGNVLLLYVGIEFLDLNPYFAQLTGMIFYTLTSYLGCRNVVFTRSA